MRFRFSAPLLLLTALAAVPAAAQVEGRYELVSLNGHALPAESPTETGVMLRRALFWFGPDGHFNVSMTAQTGQGEASQQAAGTYQVVADSLRITGEDGASPMVAYRWMLEGDTLRLHDDGENEYRLVRQAAVAAGEPWSPGTWQAVQLNGHDMPAPWPLEPQLTVTALSFVFTADGQASVRMAATMQGQSGEQEESARYTVTGDRLTILDEDGSVDEEFAWTIRGGRLQLVDANGYTYTFTRAPAP